MQNSILDTLFAYAEEVTRRYGLESEEAIAAWARYDRALDIYD